MTTDAASSLGPIVLCTDGSAHALAALAAGLELVGRDRDLVVVTVLSAPEADGLTGSGHAGPSMTGREYDIAIEATTTEGHSVVAQATRQLAIESARVSILWGEPGAAICQLAGEIGAAAIVVGTKGRGGIKRALLGSVSDHIVRHAPCSVIVTKSPD